MLAEDVKSGDGPSGKCRSDTIMIAHISEDRKHVYLVSIPRDSFTMLYDENGRPSTKGKSMRLSPSLTTGPVMPHIRSIIHPIGGPD